MDVEDDFLRLMQGVIDNPERLTRAMRPLTDHVRRMYLPFPDQLAAVALRSPKTAALFFDRVWAGLDPTMPADVGFWSKTNREMALLLIAGIALTDEAAISAQLTIDTSDDDVALRHFSKELAEGIRHEHQLAIVPVYSMAADRDAEYHEGDRNALIAIVKGLNIVSETDLTWSQVQDVRADKQAVRSLRRMRHWLDREMLGKSRAYVEDEIAVRLDEYDRTLSKHGLASAVGTLATTLDSKVLMGGPAAVAALSYAGAKDWALAAGAAIVIGRVAVHIAENLLAYRDLKEQSEVCFLAELRR